MKDSRIILRLPESLKKRLQVLVRANHSTMSEFLRQMLIKELENKKRSREE